MPLLDYGTTFDETGIDGKKPQSWDNYVMPFLQTVRTLTNTTKVDYLNVQDDGLRTTNMLTHANVEAVRIKVRNATGGSIAANSLVYFNGTYSDGSNNYPSIAKAISTTAVGSTYFAQGATTGVIANNANGTVAVFYEISAVDTSSAAVGDVVYLDTTAGGWTRTRPTGGQYIQVIGTITVVSSSVGRIVLSLGAVPEHLTGGSSGLGATFQTLTVQGASGAAADVYHFGDAGEDAADKWKISVADGGNMTWENYTSGSYVAKMTMTSAGVVSTAGAITSSGAVTGSTLVGTVSTAAQNSITSASSLATVGTITAGAWQSSTVVASAYLDADTAHLGVTQTFTGAKTFGNTVTVGANTDGHDVKFFGNASGAYMEWDESEDQLRILGPLADAAGSSGKLLLATAQTSVESGDILGQIDFQAPLETGTDAIVVSASVKAVAQGTFAANVNATDLIFYTAHDAAVAERFRFSSQGEIGIAGANYGTDGQVLTSAGGGASVAWEDAASGGADLGTANTWTADQTFNDNIKVTLGTGGDADIYYDATNLVITPDVAGSGYIGLDGDTVIPDGHGLNIGHATQLSTDTACELQYLGTANADSRAMFGRWSANAVGPQLQFVKSRNGTVGSSTIVADDDQVGRIVGYADDGTNFSSVTSIISMDIDGTPGENDTPGRITFHTTPDGSQSATERMRIDSTGLTTIACTGNDGLIVDGSAQSTGVITNLTIKDGDGNPVILTSQQVSSKAVMGFNVGGTQRMLINSDGAVISGNTVQHVGQPGHCITTTTGFTFIGVSGAPVLQLNRFDSTGTSVSLRYGTTEVGTISVDGSNAAYNTTSDYRLKENIVDLTNAVTRVKSLQPKRFNFKEAPDVTKDGFIAHEASAVVPEAVSGTKDGTKTLSNVIVDADGAVLAEGQTESTWTSGKEPHLVSEAVEAVDAVLYAEGDEIPEGKNVGDVKTPAVDAAEAVYDVDYASDTAWHESLTVPDYQGIDQAKLVPLLTAAIQELTARIEVLESA